MDFKEFAIQRNAKASETLLRNVRAVPADKLSWRPAEKTRSALEVCQEAAQSPMWGVMILNHKGWPGGTPEQMQEQMAAAMAERQSWDTVDKCEAAMDANLEKLEAAIRALPDEELETVIRLPFGPGMDLPLAEICLVQYWNTTYHTGQVCYVQLMLGDAEMH
jgi:uncharacterized damage-inducible protein DinB